MMQITTHSADETQALGQRLAKRLLPGDVIAARIPAKLDRSRLFTD